MAIDTSKSLAELADLPVPRSPSEPLRFATERSTRRTWLTTPLSELTPEAIQHLIRSGPGQDFLISLAIDHLERDVGLFGLLVTVLRCRGFPWLDNTHELQRLRKVVGGAMSELKEWDGTEAIVVESMSQRMAILEAWAQLELSLSKVPSHD